MYVKDVAAGTLTQVFAIPGNPSDPVSSSYAPSIASVVFSSDSKRLAFVLVRPDPSEQRNIAATFVTDLENGDQTVRMNLWDGAGASNGSPEYTAPAWSGDGRFLAFMDNDLTNGGALPYLYDFLTGARTPISFNPQDGSPSTDLWRNRPDRACLRGRRTVDQPGRSIRGIPNQRESGACTRHVGRHHDGRQLRA